jgi:hypothetical protein
MKVIIQKGPDFEKRKEKAQQLMIRFIKRELDKEQTSKKG